MNRVIIELSEKEKIHITERTDAPRSRIKKATFEMNVDLHFWLKLHAAKTQRNMVDIVEDALRQYRADKEA